MTTTTTTNTNIDRCKYYAHTLDMIATGELYRDEDGELRESDSPEEDWEQVGFYDYLEGAYDIRYLIGSDMEYIGCKIMVACGGPNIWIDTETCSVNLYWWGESASYDLRRSTVDELDDVMRELYESSRY